MTLETRYRLALINMAQGAQRQADSIRTWAYSVPAEVASGNEEQAQAYERVAQLLCNEADDLRKQETVKS